MKNASPNELLCLPGLMCVCMCDWMWSMDQPQPSAHGLLLLAAGAWILGVGGATRGGTDRSRGVVHVRWLLRV